MSEAVRGMPPLALLAGGRATRLKSVTETIAKSMVPVARSPFIAHQLDLIKRQEIRRVVLCVGHLGDQIEAFVGDGGALGLDVRYSRDGPVALGTGGALRKALPLLGETFLTMYGDSYLDIPFRPVIEAFRASAKSAMMTVYCNDNRWDRSNVEFVGGEIRCFNKSRSTPAMSHIDYGLGILRARAIEDRTAGEAFDLADVFTDLVARGELAGYEADRRFYEIGSPEGLRATERHLAARLASART